jgi:hypothetical protein
MNNWFDQHNRDEVADTVWLILITLAASLAAGSILAMVLKYIFS